LEARVPRSWSWRGGAGRYHCHPGIAATFVLLGAGDMAGVSLVSVHDR